MSDRRHPLANAKSRDVRYAYIFCVRGEQLCEWIRVIRMEHMLAGNIHQTLLVARGKTNTNIQIKWYNSYARRMSVIITFNLKQRMNNVIRHVYLILMVWSGTVGCIERNWHDYRLASIICLLRIYFRYICSNVQFSAVRINSKNGSIS